MSYHDSLPQIKRLLSEISAVFPPRVLEVGILDGISFITLAAWMRFSLPTFALYGIDVIIKEHVKIIVNLLEPTLAQDIKVITGSSLDVMPKMIDGNFQFDLIMLDGDHNYHTVSNDLSNSLKLLSPNGVIIVDDYHGKYETTDMWYSEAEAWSSLCAARVETEKHGVKTAVDDFISDHPELVLEDSVTRSLAAVIKYRKD